MKYLAVLSLATAALAKPLLGGVGSVVGNLTGTLSNLTDIHLHPRVNITNGTVIGNSLLGVDSFLGIPFALPPVGDLRLRQPHTYNKTFGQLPAINYAPGCIQVFGGAPPGGLDSDVETLLLANPLFQAVLGSSEDCLYLNVQRPANVTKGAKLPVVVWIYGGGFQFGSTSTYNAQGIVSRGMYLDAPFVYVSVAYRLNAFGFMPGKEAMNAGAANLGLYDQRKALEWVAENIDDFGGDPDHVVIWGESAGAISVFDQIIINNGDNTYKGKSLFHGAIMNSGSIVPTLAMDDAKPQAVYDYVIRNASCHKTDDTLDCLRQMPIADFITAVNSPPGIFGYDSVSLSYLPRPDPSSDFFPQSPEIAGLGGKFAHVPMIIGDQEDEGTLFAQGQRNLTTNDDVIEYFSSVFFPGADRDVVADLINSYPEDLSDGSPFRTGDANNIYPQYKRISAILGDITFNLIRRGTLQYASLSVDTWSYMNSYLHGTPVLGTFHGADLAVLYGTLPTTLQSPQLPIDYYISFFNHYNPNTLFPLSLNSTANVFWPKWTNFDRVMLQFNALNTTLLLDDYRSPAYDAILGSRGKLRAK